MYTSSHSSPPAGTQLRVELINDFDAIEKIYADPWIQSRVSFDNLPAVPIQSPKVFHFGAFIDGELCGVFVMVDTLGTDVEMHTLLLKKARIHSRKLARMFMQSVFSDPAINRISSMVVEGMDSVLNAAKNVGFQYEGFQKEKVLVNGEFKGFHLIGITRKEWGESCQ